MRKLQFFRARLTSPATPCGRVTTAMTRTRPRQCGQTLRSIANTLRAGRHTAFHPGHGRGRWVLIAFGLGSTKCLRAGLCMAATPAARCGRHNPASMPGLRGQYPVVSDQVAAWPRHQRRQPAQEVQRVKHEVRGAVPVRCLQLVDHLTNLIRALLGSVTRHGAKGRGPPDFSPNRPSLTIHRALWPLVRCAPRFPLALAPSILRRSRVCSTYA